MKRIVISGRIIETSVAFLTILYCVVNMIDVMNGGKLIPVEILIITVSLSGGLLLAPVAFKVLERRDLKRYMLYTGSILTMLLAITWNLWFNIDWNRDPQFLTLSFVIPGFGAHIVTLIYMNKRQRRKEI